MTWALLFVVFTAALGACFPFDIFRRMALPELGRLRAAEVLPREEIAPGLDESPVGPHATGSPKEARETFSCTGNPGPDMMDCPKAITVWSTLADDDKHLHVKSGQCRTVIEKCCSTIVCAPMGDIIVPLEDVTGRMWLPLTMRCVSGGRGGTWQNGEGSLVVKMERPTSEQCSA